MTGLEASGVDWGSWTLYQVSLFLLIMTRCLSLFVITPFLGSQQFPNMAKIGIGMCLALIFYPLIVVGQPSLPTAFVPFVVVMVKESFVGICLGFCAVILFSGIQLAGQIFGLQMGFGVVNVFDPTNQTQVPVMGQFQFLLAFLIFIVVGGHHLFLQALGKSFEVIPIGTAVLRPGMSPMYLAILQFSFEFALKLGMPVIACLLVGQVALGVVARLMPQMNVFMVTVPIQILLGLVILGMSLLWLAGVIKGGMWMLKDSLGDTLRLLSP